MSISMARGSGMRSRPFHLRRQRGQDRIDVAAGLQPEDGAAVVEQVEFDIAAAADQLLLAIGRRPRRVEIAPHQLGIDFQEGAADVLGEGEIGVPVAAVVPVVEDAADAARLPCDAAGRNIRRTISCTCRSRRRRSARRRPPSSRHGRRCVSASSWVRRRSSTGVRSAPPPNHALVVTTKRVFMCTAGTCGLRRCAISEMPEAQKRGIVGRARNLRAELGREFAVHGRAMHADLLEQAARASSTSRRRRPWRRYGRCAPTACARSGRRRRDRAMAGASSSSFSNAAQMSSRRRFEPAARAGLAFLDQGYVHQLSNLRRHCEER